MTTDADRDASERPDQLVVRVRCCCCGVTLTELKTPLSTEVVRPDDLWTRMPCPTCAVELALGEWSGTQLDWER